MKKYLIEVAELGHTFEAQFNMEIVDLIGSLVSAEPNGMLTFCVSVDEVSDEE